MSKIENEKLNKWYKQIKDYEYLKINEAKELYKLYLETKNINYLNRIIEGTLYITYNYINRNHLMYLSSSLYDIDDIISSFLELWVENINEDILLKVNSYSEIINITFIKKLNEKLGIPDTKVIEYSNVNTKLLEELLCLYISEMETKNKVDFNLFKRKYYEIYNCSFNDDYTISNVYFLISKIYNDSNIKYETDVNKRNAKIKKYIKIIIDSTLNEPFDNCINSEYVEECVINKIMLNNFINKVDELITNERNKEIMYHRFGIGNHEKLSLSDLSKKYKITECRIKQIEDREIRLLRYPSKQLRKYI